MPKASKKTKDKLYSLISERIMDARLEVKKQLKMSALTDKAINDIDVILYRLNIECPENAIDYFKD